MKPKILALILIPCFLSVTATSQQEVESELRLGPYEPFSIGGYGEVLYGESLSKPKGGLTIGNTSDEVFEQFPNATIDPYPFDDSYLYITAVGEVGDAAIRFTIHNGKVVSMRAGTLDSVTAEEDCS